MRINCLILLFLLVCTQLRAQQIITKGNKSKEVYNELKVNKFSELTPLQQSGISNCFGLQISLGTPAFDRGNDIAPAGNNELFVAGVTQINGNDDILVSRIDLNGNIIWSKVFGGQYSESVRKIRPTSDGGVIICGQTKSFGNYSGDMLALKVSGNGSLVWSKKFGIGSTYGDLAMDIIETSDGGYALSGILNVIGVYADAVVIKLDNSLNVTWSKQLGRSDGDDGVGIVQKGDTLVTAVDLQHGAGEYSFSVTKLLMNNGNVVSSKELIPQARGLFNPYIVRNPAQPGYIVSGHTIDGVSYANMKHAIIYLNENLDVVKTRLIDVTPVANDFFTDIYPQSDGSLIGCASPQSGSGGYIYKISNTGTVDFAKNFNGSTNRRLNRVMVSGSDIIAIGGIIINGQEDFFIAGMKTDGTVPGNCHVSNLSLSIQQPTYSSANFGWTTISNISYANTTASLQSTAVQLNKTDICPKPTLDFNFQSSTCSPKTIQFSATLQGIQSYQWNFDNGQTNSSSLTPSVTYSVAGSYTIKLVVQYAGGCFDSVSKTININIIPDNNLILNSDTTICPGDSVLIRTDPVVLNYCWQATSGNVPSVNNWVKPVVNTTYSLNSVSTGTNLVVNGDFSLGNTGFSSQYYYSSSGLSAGVYGVGSNITSWHPNMTPCHDHTTGTGNMMMVNGADQQGVKVWSQTIPVQPNTNYAFYTWLQTITTINPAQLQFSINGQLIGNIFTANTQSCIWDRFYSIWNSGNNSSATISIMNMNTQFSGNDFALDDIYFGEVLQKTDTLHVNVTGFCDSIKISGPDKVCSVNDVLLYTISKAPNCTQQYSLQVDNSYATVISQTPDTLKLSFRKNGITTIKVAYINSCKVVIDSLQVEIRISPSAINLGPDINTCNDTLFSVNAGKGFINYLWQDGTTDSIHVIGSSGIYTVDAENLCGVRYTDSLKVDMNRLRLFSVYPQTAEVCSGDSILFHATGGNLYSWTPSNNFNNPSDSVTRALISISQDFSVSITDEICGRDTVIVIPVIAKTHADIFISKSNDVNCTTDSSVLMASGGASYSWRPLTYITRQSNGQITVRPPSSLTYYVTGIDAAGCSGQDSITVNFIKEGNQNLYIPNAFTPNGDGLNDWFLPVFTGPAAQYDFRVYNRWGQLVFRSTTPGKGWDGKFHSVLQPGDVYVFYITAQGGCNGKFEQKGTFVLIR